MSYTSKFRILSLGRVAEHKARNSKMLKVHPVEFLNFYNGKLKSDERLVEDKGVDAQDIPYSVDTITDDCFEAEWLSLFDSNRITAPDMRKGEHVLIWQADDCDKYYWTDTAQKRGTRKLETVIYAISDTQDLSIEDVPLDKCYYYKWSTHDKILELVTSNEDGEPFKFTIKLNTAVGSLTVEDDVGNIGYFHSKSGNIGAKNKDGTIAEINGGDFNVKALNINFDYTNFNANGSKTEFNGGTIKHNGKSIDDKHEHGIAGPKTTPPIN